MSLLPEEELKCEQLQKENDMLRQVMTSLPDGTRVRKDDLRMDACGTIDELNSYVGLLVTEVPIDLVQELQHIQRQLFGVGAKLVGVEQPENFPDEPAVHFLLERVESINQRCGTVNYFILPGGCRAASISHICRTVCRRAERAAVAIDQNDVVPFLNRLSTYFFALSRYLNFFYDFREIKA